MAKVPKTPTSDVGSDYAPDETKLPNDPIPAKIPLVATSGPASKGSDWDPSAPSAVSAGAKAKPCPVETARRLSGVTDAMIKLREQFRSATRDLHESPSAFGATKDYIGPQNLVATSFGQKWSDGHPTGNRGVLVMVRTKVDEDQVHPKMLAPRYELVKGEKVFFDVIEVGQPSLRGGYQISELPADFGASISTWTPTSLTGTYGARVLRQPVSEHPNGQKCILSCNHILANINQAPIGTKTYQPGIRDAWNGNQRFVAELVDSVRLQLFSSQVAAWSNPNRVDAALAWTSPSDCAPRFHNNIDFDPEPVAYFDGMTVIKEGRTTGYTVGTIHGPDADPMIPYGTDQAGNGTAPYGYFTGQIQILGSSGLFSDHGDSGALVCGLHSDGKYHPIGLLFSGSSSTGYTWANPIQWVLEDLNIDSIQYDLRPGA